MGFSELETSRDFKNGLSCQENVYTFNSGIPAALLQPVLMFHGMLMNNKTCVFALKQESSDLLKCQRFCLRPTTRNYRCASKIENEFLQARLPPVFVYLTKDDPADKIQQRRHQEIQCLCLQVWCEINFTSR